MNKIEEQDDPDKLIRENLYGGGVTYLAPPYSGEDYDCTNHWRSHGMGEGRGIQGMSEILIGHVDL